MNIRYLLLIISMTALDAAADNSTLDAAIGGGTGGAAGAAIGNEVGGRDGAIIGGALGGAIGTAVNTDDKQHTNNYGKTNYRGEPPHSHGGSRFCPPGQAKKGRC